MLTARAALGIDEIRIDSFTRSSNLAILNLNARRSILIEQACGRST